MERNLSCRVEAIAPIRRGREKTDNRRLCLEMFA